MKILIKSHGDGWGASSIGIILINLEDNTIIQKISIKNSIDEVFLKDYPKELCKNFHDELFSLLKRKSIWKRSCGINAPEVTDTDVLKLIDTLKSLPDAIVFDNGYVMMDQSKDEVFVHTGKKIIKVYDTMCTKIVPIDFEQKKSIELILSLVN